MARGSIYVGNQLVAQTTEELFEPGEFEALDRAASDEQRHTVMNLERRQLNNLVAELLLLNPDVKIYNAPDIGTETIAAVARTHVKQLIDEVKRLRRAAVMPPVVNAAHR